MKSISKSFVFLSLVFFLSTTAVPVTIWACKGKTKSSVDTKKPCHGEDDNPLSDGVSCTYTTSEPERLVCDEDNEEVTGNKCEAFPADFQDMEMQGKCKSGRCGDTKFVRFVGDPYGGFQAKTSPDNCS
jgi:hypothetical protein